MKKYSTTLRIWMLPCFVLVLYILTIPCSANSPRGIWVPKSSIGKNNVAKDSPYIIAQHVLAKQHLDGGYYGLNHEGFRSEAGIGQRYGGQEFNRGETHPNHSYMQTYPNSAAGLNALLKQASTASVGILFALLIWRSLTSYELASQFHSGWLRYFSVLPTLVLMVTNIIGFVVNLAKPLGFKNHLKFILATNIIREWLELVFNIWKLIFTPVDADIPRDIYFGRFFMNIWWSFLCFSFSRSRWVLQNTQSPIAGYDYQQKEQYYQQQRRQQMRNF